MPDLKILASHAEPIAIIGSACRFPGALNSPSKLWEFLREPRDILGKIPKERFNADAFYHPNGLHHGTSNVTESYLLQEDPRLFDANFFNVKPVEAHSVDPQQRLLLEVVYESLEAAGLQMKALAGTDTGVFVGLMCADFSEHLQRDIDSLPTYMATGTARSIISNRLSYFFDWHGPSMTIDTACSSSLVAVHQAVQLLRSGESDLAVAAGANLILGPELYVGESKLKMLSPDSRSRMWDVKADGYARGEGIASIILKRLSDAVRDGDRIECVIRESGINSDGRTKGITMPNETAQTDLIRRVYQKAGLDPREPSQRCQYFEAHGTGTAAGDAREAEGVSQAFFAANKVDEPNPLYIGSIKTVIGHTEGTAGLAGLLKASLAIQNSTIPPNLLFDELSPSVAPFYGSLQIATSAKPWPAVQGPRRASVNSFGFGGTNAHVILESHDASEPAVKKTNENHPSIPFLFSAGSEAALENVLKAYSNHLRSNPSLSATDLAYTLSSKRSALPVRAAFGAKTVSELASKIDAHIERSQNKEEQRDIASRPASAAPHILGVFTGQGAQWPTMGRELVRRSTLARTILQELEASLAVLPASDRPSWSLTRELLKDAKDSKVSEAMISQPLCTAIQIILVEHLRAAGIQFAAVVGHSSGEIAAAYAAGFINRVDAICIAYYRGLCSESYPMKDTMGAMLAVGTSLEDATEVCNLEDFQGRICVAASNSASSVTLSGDEDAIDEVQALFDDEKKFTRKLRVDKAYHSHHMIPSSKPYRAALEAVIGNIEIPSHGACPWYSSVLLDTKMEASEELRASYWVDNMLHPVLFNKAVEKTHAEKGPFDLVIEVGPHPALQGPVKETLTSLDDAPLLYTGLLTRSTDDVTSLSNALGYIWARFKAAVDLTSYEAKVADVSGRTLLKCLPSYQWEHGMIYWHDSRMSRAFRNRKDVPNALLGSRIADGIDGEIRWRNMIRPSQLPWIRGHQLQGQMVYPAAAYVSTAIEACREIVQGQVINLVEVQDFVIGKALTFEGDQSTSETLFVISDIVTTQRSGEMTVYEAKFKYHASLHSSSDDLPCLASGTLSITAGPPDSDSHTEMPSRDPEPPVLAAVSEAQFYSSLANLGYQYTEDFRGLFDLRRKLNYGTANVKVPTQEEADAVLVHPALLDVAFQAIFLAYWWPNDGSLDQLHIPTSIAKIRIDIAKFRKGALPGSSLTVDSHLTENPLHSSGIGGDVDVFDSHAQTSLLQIQGVRVTAFSERSSQSDRFLFSEHVWGPAVPDGKLAANNRASTADYELALDLERLTIYYMRRLSEQFPPEKRNSLALEWHHEALFDFVTHVLSQTEQGKQRFTKARWLTDTWESMVPIIEKYPNSIEINLTRAVGENLAAAVRGETQILEHMFRDDLLNRYYTEAMGLKEATDFLSRTVAQLVHRYPHMNILEIGAGTGGATKAIMRDIGRSFASYTFTDISTGFFEMAMQVFSGTANRMIFRALDCERDIAEQGYKEHSYDLVIASLVLHATKSLETTMANVRRLLRPGGYLIMLEITNNDVLRVGFAMSGLPGWWMGRDEGRTFSPCVDSAKWHEVLLKTGFSGVDTLTPQVDTLPRPLSVIVSQATDDRVGCFRQPLLHPRRFGEAADEGTLVIIGGTSLLTVVLIDKLLEILRPFDLTIIQFKRLAEIDTSVITSKALVLGLTELDSPVFEQLSPETMKAMKLIFDYQRTILWVTRGCREDQPYMNMTVGLGRTLALEHPELCLQYLDLDISKDPDPRLIAECLLRLRLQADTMLWSIEQEIVQEDERLVIPRLIPTREANNRYNASKRTVTELRSLNGIAVTLQTKGRSYILQETQHAKKADAQLIRVSKSTLSTVLGPLHGVVGCVLDTGKLVLGLAEESCSMTEIAQPRFIEVDVDSSDEVHLLTWLYVEIRADVLLSSLPRNSKAILVHPEADLAALLVAQAKARGINLLFVTDSKAKQPEGEPWIYLHSMMPRRQVKDLLPNDISTLVSCRNGQSDLSGLISSCIGERCSIRNLDQMVDMEDYLAAHTNIDRVLRQAVSHSTELASTPVTICSPVDLIGEIPRISDSIQVMDWSSSSAQHVPVTVSSVDNTIHFKADRTYVLFGLTSDLGLSLCDWMVSRGARNIVATSRRPMVDSRWLEGKKAKGVRIEFVANDITDRESVQALVARLRRDWQPIAGIMHGAMVLEDVPFSEMSYAAMDKVLRPKVLGATHLDELFQDDSLDFFIFFSSLAAASGNRGQSNYSAANMFMTSKTFQRRRKGLAASVLHIGAVMGVGYVMREVSETVFPAIRRAGFMWMEERGFHQCIGEAILAGQPGSTRNPEIVTGLRIVNIKEEEPTPWMSNPRFQHCINFGDDPQGQQNRGKATVALRSSLQQAATMEEVGQLIQDAVISKLQISLQLQFEDEAKRTAVLSSNSDDLGVDSLVAVEIRSWFLKEMDLDMPVLKILGGATIGELISFAIEKLPETLLTGLDNTKAASTEESKASSVLLPPDEPFTTPKAGSDFTDNAPPPPSSIDVPPSSFTSVTDGNDQPEAVKDLERPPELTSKPRLDVLSLDNIERIVPMSFGQERFWFLRHYIQDQTTFNITFSVALKGPLRVERMEDAILKVGSRHEALRTAFVQDGGRVAQTILKEAVLRVEKATAQDDVELRMHFEEMRDYVFDIEHGESMRVKLLSSSRPDHHHMIIGYHHINMDGASLEVFLDDLSLAYMGKPFNPEKPLQYADFSEGQRRELQSGKLQTELDYWKQELSGCFAALPLLPSAAAKERQAIRHYDHSRVDHRVGEALSSKVKQFCRKQKASPFHFYMAVLGVTLHRLLDNVNDLCIGMADSNRFEGNLSSSMGMYLNVLPVRFQLSGVKTFGDLLKVTRRKVYSSLVNSHVPIDVILEALKVSRSTLHSPLFQAFINYRSGVAEKRNLGAVEGEGAEYQFGRTGYDISLDIFDDPNSTPLLMFSGQKQLYSVQDTEKFANLFVGLLDRFSDDPTAAIASPELPLVSSATSAVANLSHGRTEASEWPTTVIHHVEKWVREAPEATALNDSMGNTMTYGRLGMRSNRIAAVLLRQGVASQSRICVFQEPGFDFVCSMLAIMRIGAVFVALDCQTPMTRLSVMIANCKPVCVIVHNNTSSKAEALDPSENVPLLNISSSLVNMEAEAKDNSPILASATQTAAILYTSGTTGVPKGILLSHENLRNYFEWVDVTGVNTVLQQSAFSFDLALKQVLLALTYGGTLVIVPQALRGDPLAITKIMAQERVTWTGATPSEYRSWVRFGHDNIRQCESWRLALSVGERLPQALLDDLQKTELSQLRLHNAYGPCETTMGATRVEVEIQHGDSPLSEGSLVGKPGVNVALYIMDDEGNPVESGTPGEIYIGGAGVAVGYLDDEAQTKLNFLHNPHASDFYKSKGWNEMYRTGDKGCLTAEGELALLGRIDGDSQVKIRGIRVELQEIENDIKRITGEAIWAVCVTARGKESPLLVAHVVYMPEAEGRETEILRKLASDWALPRYMYPAVIVPVDSLPVAPSGKLDRKAIQQLPVVQSSQPATAAVQLTNMEIQLRQIWNEVLDQASTEQEDVERYLQADSDFFHVGGNSMLMIHIQELIKKRLGASLTVMRLFERSKLRDMAAEIQESVSDLNATIDWEEETALEKSLVDIGRYIGKAPATPSTNDSSGGLVVVMTGATGFLGMEILRQLLNSPDVAKIHCIAVRNPTKLGDLASSPLISVYTGELGQARLGLSFADEEVIFSEAHVLLHNGSDVSFLKTYQTLRVPNLESTKELAHLALRHSVPFHYVSTTAVGRLNHLDDFAEVSLSGHAPPSDWQDGYSATKWASEVFLERTAERLGLPVHIHRPSSITGDGVADTDVMNSVVKYAKEMRAVPVSSRWRGILDFISVKGSAVGIVDRLLMDNLSCSPSKEVSGVHYVHHSGEVTIPIDGLREYLEKADGETYKEWALSEWVDGAVDKGMNVLVAAYLAAIDEMDLDVVFQKLIKS